MSWAGKPLGTKFEVTAGILRLRRAIRLGCAQNDNVKFDGELMQ